MLALENLYTIPKGEDRLPTIFFQGRAVNRPGTTYSFGQTFLLFPFTVLPILVQDFPSTLAGCHP